MADQEDIPLTSPAPEVKPEVKPRKTPSVAPEVPEAAAAPGDPLADQEAAAVAAGFKTQRIGAALRVDY